MKGRIVNQGMGGFLNPPSHPEHVKSVHGYDYSMSLSSAAQCMHLDEAVRSKAQQIIRNWVPLPLAAPMIQDWIHHVLGYFRHCYSPDGLDRSCSRCLIYKATDTQVPPVDHHLGVMFIRQFYPHFVPCEEHFQNAYWGKPNKQKEESRCNALAVGSP